MPLFSPVCKLRKIIAPILNVSCQYQIEYPSKKAKSGAFPSGPVVKTSPSNAGGMDSIPGQGAKIPKPRSQNSRSNIVTNSIKILKIIHIKKKNLKNNAEPGSWRPVDTQ